MFSKVVKRVRRLSEAQKLASSSSSPVVQLQQPQDVLRVNVAPELLRFSDFSTPFPSVSVGGYTRFYTTYTMISKSTESLHFTPLLSQQPEPSPSSETPPKTPLFDTLQRPCLLPMIREVSLESLTLSKPKHLSISTCTPSHPLKRRRRRLLRTPSIERDFKHIHGRSQSSSNTSIITVSEPDADTSSTDIAPFPSSPVSTDSQLSHERSDSECPLTPSTSLDSEGDDHETKCSTELYTDKLERHHESDSVTTRPISSISFCTAESEFTEV